MAQLKDELKNKSCHFLMAEDDPADAEVFTEMLNAAFEGKYSVVCVDRFEKTVKALAEGSFEALILDMNLPDRSGVENVYQLGKTYPSLPIIVLTGNEDLELAIDSLQNGAQDYLSKNKVTPEVLQQSLRYAKERKLIELKLKDALNEVSKKNGLLEVRANHDTLTGLANRSYFRDVAIRNITRAKRLSKKIGLLYFDIDEFKKINDTYGHLVGDELLKQVAVRLKLVIREADFLARIGGDEFVIITDVIDSEEEVYPILQRIQDQLERPFKVVNHEMQITSSIGIAYYPHANSLDMLIKQADRAMYQAKNNPCVSACVYTEKLAAQFARVQQIESYMAEAIENDEFTAQFQPIVNINNDIHIEALARWSSKHLGFVSPAEFIPVAEKTPIINSITQIITTQSHELYKKLEDHGLNIDRIAINVSATQLTSEHFCKLFLNWLEELSFPAEKVCLELTERQVVQNIPVCREQFQFLRKKGIQIALDDFGSGFSSITHLLDLPFDILKLDRVLIRDINNNHRNQALVAGIVEMAHRLEMKVVAEGIETEDEKQKVIDLGCDYCQGYLISKPLSLSDASWFCAQF